jgi:hypothetical protein
MLFANCGGFGMRVRMRLLLLILLAVSFYVLAQNESKPQPPVIQIADGGTSGRMESIFVPPKANAPFSLTLVTEWSRPLGNGGTFTLTNQRHIVRDGKGRIYQERWLLVPKGGKMESRMDVFQITDPTQHTWLNCGVQEKVCEILPYRFTTDAIYKPTIGTTGPLPDGKGSRQHEELGLSNSNGVNTTGYRETLTINPGVFGNDQPMVTTREFWYSSELGFNLISKIDDPQNGRQSFEVKELTTSEPDPRFFETPDGYKVVDHRKPKEGSN